MTDEDKVTGFLRDFPRGLSIVELASKTGLKRHQIKIILSKLDGAGKITIRVIGNVQLNYWN